MLNKQTISIHYMTSHKHYKKPHNLGSVKIRKLPIICRLGGMGTADDRFCGQSKYMNAWLTRIARNWIKS